MGCPGLMHAASDFMFCLPAGPEHAGADALASSLYAQQHTYTAPVWGSGIHRFCRHVKASGATYASPCMQWVHTHTHGRLQFPFMSPSCHIGQPIGRPPGCRGRCCCGYVMLFEWAFVFSPGAMGNRKSGQGVHGRFCLNSFYHCSPASASTAEGCSPLLQVHVDNLMCTCN